MGQRIVAALQPVDAFFDRLPSFVHDIVLFDQMVTNYAVSQESKYILGEVPVRVSYDSDFSVAERTLVACATEVTGEIIAETGKEPFIRAEFIASVEYHTGEIAPCRRCSEPCPGRLPHGGVDR